MNKNLKLALIFVGVCAVLFVVFNIGDIIKSLNGEDEGNSPSSFEEQLENLKSRMEAMDGYDQKAFKDLVADIDVWKKRTDIDEEGRATLRLTLFEGMLKKIEADYNNTLANYNDKPADAHKRLSNDAKGLDDVAKIMEKPLDIAANEIKTLHQLYINVYNFVNSGHKPTAEFNEESKTWISFDDHKDVFTATAAKYRNNPLYSKLNHINKFNEGLSDSNVRAIVEQHRDSYYEELAKKIIDYFSNSGDEQTGKYSEVLYDFNLQTGDDSPAYKNLLREYRVYRASYETSN